MPLISYVADQIWLGAYPVRLAGTSFEARMTVIRLASGQIMLHSPCSLTAALAEELSALGPLAHIVVPGNFHHLHAVSAQAAFPNAKTWICPGVEKKPPALKYDGVLGEVAPADWLGEIDQVLVQGTRVGPPALYVELDGRWSQRSCWSDRVSCAKEIDLERASCDHGALVQDVSSVSAGV